MCGSLTAFVWICYPIAWGLCEGGNVIAPDSEAVFYGVLDFIAKPVFSALLIWSHRNIDPAQLGLRIRDYSDDPTVGARPLQEKQRFVDGPISQRNNNNNAVDGQQGIATHVA